MSRWLSPARVALWYALLAAGMTWPLVLGLGRDLPWDLGDSLLNCWILAWNSEHILSALRGNVAALSGLWHGNIFHPEPYTLAYSELLMAQTLQALPVYALTGNTVLAYNLLFLSTFVLSGLGMYLLVREWTGDPRAAFLAGLLFGFLPYRTAEGPHLQVLSSQWMPFALYGFRRFFATGRLRPLAGGAAAVVAQNLSCGYYLVYFALLMPVYGTWELVRGRHWRQPRTLAALGGAGLVIAAGTLPFMQPYLALRAHTGQQRSLEESASFAANVRSFTTADADLRLWGRLLPSHPRPEGNLFPGVVLVIAAACGAAVPWVRAWRAARPAVPVAVGGSAGRWALGLALLGALLATAMWLWWVFGGSPRIEWGDLAVRNRSALRPFAAAAALAGLALALSPRVRQVLSRSVRSFETCLVLSAAVALYLSLGPVPKWGDAAFRSVDLFGWLFTHVPGFDGLRVPARFAMVAFMFLSVLAGMGLAAILGRSGRVYGWSAMLVALLIVLESSAMPMPLNTVTQFTALEPVPPQVATVRDVPVEYHLAARLPASAVIVEFPLGDVGWDLWAVYHSTFHWKPLVNGFSGGFPPHYARLARLLFDVNANPDLAWEAMRAQGPTHAIVHRRAYSRNARSPEAWLEARGARRILVAADVSAYELPSAGSVESANAPLAAAPSTR